MPGIMDFTVSLYGLTHFYRPKSSGVSRILPITKELIKWSAGIRSENPIL
jgi:hypothetical protein